LADGGLLLAATKGEAAWACGYMAPNFDQPASFLRKKLIFDGRNLYDPERLAEKPVKSRKPCLIVRAHHEAVGAGSGSLR
jgi:hypothetical protein